jgi:hypothetical protein
MDRQFLAHLLLDHSEQARGKMTRHALSDEYDARGVVR